MLVLIGIAAGALVFIGSLLAVFMLLRQGGSFERMAQEAVGLPVSLEEQKLLLYDELLDKANSFEQRPAPIGINKLLEGNIVSVKDLVTVGDVVKLHDISCGKPCGGIFQNLAFDANEMIWRYLPQGPFNSFTELKNFYLKEEKDSRHFVLLRSNSRLPIGMVTLGNHSPRDLRIELMNLWLSPAFQGTAALTEVVLLLLTHLFEKGYRRVEWQCDGHNVRARRAAHSLGFIFEGVMRKHRILKNCNVDTVVFAAINSEWGLMKEHLQNRLQQKKVSSSVAHIESEQKKMR